MTLPEKIEMEQRLASYKGEDEVLKASKVLELYRKDRPLSDPFLSGLPTLDHLTGGFYPGQLIVISGVTGQGKTTLAQTFTFSLMEKGARPLWFSYELPVDDFLRAFPGDYPNYLYLPAKLKDNKTNWIEERILEAKLKYGTKAVFIDHLHYLISMSPKANTSFLIGETVRKLKQMAIEHRIIIFLIAHMQKTKPDEEPGLGHARDSSFVEQEADSVFYVWRFKEDKKITVCKVAKNRRRGLIDDRLQLVLTNGRYYEKA
jgi:replicative DNA helicase